MDIVQQGGDVLEAKAKLFKDELARLKGDEDNGERLHQFAQVVKPV